MPNFRHDRSAVEVHSALKTALHALEKAQQCAVHWFGEILDRKLYRELGFSSINQYAEIELGFSSTRTYDFIMLSGKLKKLPKVKAKLESGELGYTAARVLAPIVDKANEDGWLKFAMNHSRRELEQEVKRAKKEAADAAAGQPPLIAVPKPQSQPPKAKWNSAKPKLTAPSATAKSAVLANAIRLQFHRQRGERSWPTTATNASVRAATTRNSSKFTTISQGRRADRMTRIISFAWVQDVIN